MCLSSVVYLTYGECAKNASETPEGRRCFNVSNFQQASPDQQCRW